MSRETRSNLWRRDGSVAREVRIPSSSVTTGWSGFESDLLWGVDSRLGVATAGSNVTQWSDQKPGSSAHLVQAGSTLQPTYVTTAHGPAIRTDGVDDVMNASGITGWSGGQDVTIVALFDLINTGQYADVFQFAIEPIFWRHGYQIQYWGGGPQLIANVADSSGEQSIAETATPQTNITACMITYDGTRSWFFRDDMTIGSDTTPAVTVGAIENMRIGKANFGTSNVDIYSIFALDRVVTSGERNQIFTTLEAEFSY